MSRLVVLRPVLVLRLSLRTCGRFLDPEQQDPPEPWAWVTPRHRRRLRHFRAQCKNKCGGHRAMYYFTYNVTFHAKSVIKKKQALTPLCHVHDQSRCIFLWCQASSYRIVPATESHGQAGENDEVTASFHFNLITSFDTGFRWRQTR